MIERICWTLLMLLHVPPALALFRPSQLSAMYGVEQASGEFALIQHRAALFLVIVIICIWAALRPEVRVLASVAVGTSMGSFLLIWWMSGMAPQLRVIAFADLIGLPILLLAARLAYRQSGA